MRLARPKKEISKNNRPSTRLNDDEFLDFIRCSNLERMTKSEYLRFAIKTTNDIIREKHGVSPLKSIENYEGYDEYEDFDDEDNDW